MNDLHELQREFKQHAAEDLAFQKESIGRAEDIQKKLDAQPTREDIAIIVERVIRDTLLSKGRFALATLTTTAIIIGALITIFGGFKLLAGFLFFPRQ